jgi:hypothetical protein
MPKRYCELRIEHPSHLPLVTLVTEVAQTSVNPSVINVKTDGEDPSGLLKNFQDIMRKQRPEGVSHLLQDNLPKCESHCYLPGTEEFIT